MLQCILFWIILRSYNVDIKFAAKKKKCLRGGGGTETLPRSKSDILMCVCVCVCARDFWSSFFGSFGVFDIVALGRSGMGIKYEPDRGPLLLCHRTPQNHEKMMTILRMTWNDQILEIFRDWHILIEAGKALKSLFYGFLFQFWVKKNQFVMFKHKNVILWYFDHFSKNLMQIFWKLPKMV